MVETRVVCIALPSWRLFSGFQSGLCGGLVRFRVEMNPVLGGLLNGDVGSYVELNFGGKSCVSLVSLLVVAT